MYAVKMTASRFYSLSLTFSCLNFPVVFSRWTSDFWRGNCSCSACIKNTSVQEYSLDYMIQVLYMLCPQTQTDNEGLSSKCVRLFTQYYPKYLFKYIFNKKFLIWKFFRPSIYVWCLLLWLPVCCYWQQSPT